MSKASTGLARFGLGAALSAAMVVAGTAPASAHVKWFCAFDVAGQPRGLAEVLCPDFEKLVGLSVGALMLGCVVEGTPVGTALLRAIDRVTVGLRDNSELLIRATLGFFFVALWTTGGIILTPELTTTSTLIPWLQLAFATGLLWRRTLPFTAAGIVALFATGVQQYGAFHLADYPIFLGIAAYLVLTAMGRDLFGLRPLDVVRWAAAITLMWASIEKWAYPQWTFPLLVQNPGMAMGFDNEFFMRAAGVVEFTLAFALIWTPLVRRGAAAILAGTFIAAVAQFGKIDAIGHSAIVVVLLAIMADNAVAEGRRLRLVYAPFGYAAALALFLAVYYVAHAFVFGSSLA